MKCIAIWAKGLAQKNKSELAWFVASAFLGTVVVGLATTGTIYGAEWWDALTAIGTSGATLFAAIAVMKRHQAEVKAQEREAQIEEIELSKIKSELKHWDGYIHRTLSTIENFLDDWDGVGHQPQEQISSYLYQLEMAEGLPSLPDTTSIQSMVRRSIAAEIRGFEQKIIFWKIVAKKFCRAEGDVGSRKIDHSYFSLLVMELDAMSVSLRSLLPDGRISRPSTELFIRKNLDKLHQN